MPEPKFQVPITTNLLSIVFKQFFAPIFNIGKLDSSRKCPVLADQDWLISGIFRALKSVASGRDFLQQLSAYLSDELKRSHYFATLTSKRRLGFVTDSAEHVLDTMQTEMPDFLAEIEELDGFQVWAGDGHWHEHATHDAAKPRKSGNDCIDAKYAIGHIYGINLRTRGLVHLAHCDEDTRRKEHEMHALKRLDSQTLRQRALKGQKVLWVWDRAGIDFDQWHRWKTVQGSLFCEPR